MNFHFLQIFFVTLISVSPPGTVVVLGSTYMYFPCCDWEVAQSEVT